MAIRLSFFLLLLANLLFFAWVQGYFGAADEGREPLRVTQQLNAAQLRIVRDVQAPAAKKGETPCRVISGLSMANADALKAAVEAVGGAAKVLPVAEPTLHLIVISDLANQAAADKKAAELARLGVEGHSAVAGDKGRYEIVLGSFQTEAAAHEFLQGLAKRGLKSARVDSREQPALKARVETRGAASTPLPQLIAPYADATIGECPP